MSQLHILIHCRNIPYLNTWLGDPSRISAAIAYLNTCRVAQPPPRHLSSDIYYCYGFIYWLMVKHFPKLEKWKNFTKTVIQVDEKRFCPSAFVVLQFSRKVIKEKDEERGVKDLVLLQIGIGFFVKTIHLFTTYLLTYLL